jgi:hypothetical protein
MFYVKFDVSLGANINNMNNILACNMTQFSMIKICRRFGGAYRRHRPISDGNSRSYLNFDKLLQEFTLSHSIKIFSVT